MAVRVGLCGFTMPIEHYARHFPVVEIQPTFQQPAADGARESVSPPGRLGRSDVIASRFLERFMPRFTSSYPPLRWALAALVLLIAAPVEAQRLPRAVVPEHYDLAVTPDLAKATFAGTTRIRARLDRPATEIVLNA